MALSQPRRLNRRARAYALCAALLSQGSPIGGLALRAVVEGQSFEAQLAEHALLYAYMSLATFVAFTTFGYALGRVADERAQRQRVLRLANRRLRRLAEIDALTGVLNRRAIFRRLRAELGRAERQGSYTALILLDLDHFKTVNDRHGHGAGDRVLRRLGRSLHRASRASDSAGRIGGDEFLVVLPTTSEAEALGFAERLRQRFARTPTDPSIPPVTASLGVATIAPHAGSDLASALGLADAAMYRAKAEGRNRVCREAGLPQDAV